MLESDQQFVLLDTNVFVNASYNVGSRDLRRLEELVSHGTIAIITTDVVVREVHARIAREVKAAHSKHQKFRAESDLRVLRAARASSHVLKEFSPEAVDAELRTAFDDWLQRTAARILSTAEIAAGPILADYFDLKPPFAEGKKRKEFPDAFSVAALRQWIRENEAESLIVVTSDQGFADAAALSERVERVPALSALLDEVYSNDEARAKFLKYEVIKRRAVLLKWAKDVFEDRILHVADRWEADVLETRVEQVHLTDEQEGLDIVSMEAGTATIVTMIDIHFKADIRYGDESMASHDREDGTIYWNHIEETVDERAEDLELELEVTFDGLDPDRFSIEKVNLPTIDRVMVVTSIDKELRRSVAY